jgi:hypothetical protein
MGVAFGPGFPLIRAQALGAGRYPLQSLTRKPHPTLSEGEGYKYNRD